MNEARDKSAREYAEEQTAEFHVFEATITSTGEKVWQYWYTDDQGLNQHSLYYETKQEAIDAYIKFNGLQISAIIYSQADMDACAASKQQEIDRLVEVVREAREALVTEIRYIYSWAEDDFIERVIIKDHPSIHKIDSILSQYPVTDKEND